MTIIDFLNGICCVKVDTQEQANVLYNATLNVGYNIEAASSQFDVFYNWFFIDHTVAFPTLLELAEGYEEYIDVVTNKVFEDHVILFSDLDFVQ